MKVFYRLAADIGLCKLLAPYPTLISAGWVSAMLRRFRRLLHPHSAVALPTGVLDDSTGLRTRLYWGQLLVIAAVTPLSFALNKVWTFAAVRRL